MNTEDMRTAPPSIKRNYIYSTLYQVLTLITPLITAPYTARIFEPDGNGIQSFTTSNVTYFILFAALGTATYGQREIATRRDDPKEASRTFWEIELLSVLTTGVSLLAWGIFLFLNPGYRPYYLVQTLSIIAVMLDVSWFFSGYEEFRSVVLRNTLVKLIGIVVLFVFVHKKSDLLLYLALLSATGLLGNLSMWTYLPRFLVQVDLPNLQAHLKQHLRQTLLYFIPTIATSVYTVLDKTMIGVITHDSFENGYYEQTTKIVRMAFSTIMSLNTVMASRMAWLYARNETGEMKARLRQSMSFTLYLGIPMIFGLWGVADNLVPWFYGKGYEEVIPLIRIYGLLLVAIGISTCLDAQYLMPSGQRRKSNRGILTGAAVNFCLNIVMIPLWGARGAAAASVVAETVIAVIYVRMSGAYMDWKTIGKLTWKKLIAATVMLAVVLLIGYGRSGSVWCTVLQVLAGCSIYVIVTCLEKDEFALYGIDKIRSRWNVRGRTGR